MKSDQEPPGRQEPVPTEQQTGFWPKIRALFANGNNKNLRDSLKGVIEQHENGGSVAEIHPQERSMMLNLLRFPDVRVDDVMVPRADIVAIDISATVMELLSAFSSASHSRIPVYRNTLDDPIGMIHIKDFLHWLTQGTKEPSSKAKAKTKKNAAASNSSPERKPGDGICHAGSDVTIEQAGIMREVLFVPPSMRAGDLLVKMQSTHIHMAIVVDEYGGTDGLATIEDVVEEIVGEIADEHDDETEVIAPDGKGNFIADARAPIEEVEKLLNIDLLPDEQDEETDTLGGFVFSILGRVPARGEVIHHASGVEFEILQADPRRINKLKIHTPSPAAR